MDLSICVVLLINVFLGFTHGASLREQLEHISRRRQESRGLVDNFREPLQQKENHDFGEDSNSLNRITRRRAHAAKDGRGRSFFDQNRKKPHGKKRHSYEYGRRSNFQYDPFDVGPIVGAPSVPGHLPEAEALLPGHTLLRPALGMLQSSIKFPHIDKKRKHKHRHSFNRHHHRHSRRSFFRFDPNDVGPIIGAPSMPSHLPEAEPILPGHTLIRPAMGMLKSSVKFPHRDMDGGAGVYGNINSLGIRYDGRNERVLYTGFRRSTPSGGNPLDYIMVVPSKIQNRKGSKPRFSPADLGLGMNQKRGRNNVRDTYSDSARKPLKNNNKLILYIADPRANSLYLTDLLKDQNEIYPRNRQREKYPYYLTHEKDVSKLRQGIGEHQGSVRTVADWFQNSAKDTKNWFDEAGQDTKNWFDKAGQDTKNWADQAGKDTINWFNKAGEDTKNWAINAEQDTVHWFDKAGQDTKNWAGQAGKDTLRWFDKAGEDTADMADFVKEDTVHWFDKAEKDTADWADHAGKDTVNWFQKAGKDTGDWFVNAFYDVKDFFG